MTASEDSPSEREPAGDRKPTSRRHLLSVSDADIGAARHGDPRAVEIVVRAVQPLVMAYCRSRLTGRGVGHVSAEHLAQEILIAVASALGRADLDASTLLPFVYGIASQKLIDAWRGHGREVPRTSTAVDENHRDDSLGPEARALQADAAIRMGDLLDLLPDHYREIVVLRLGVGLSAEETAGLVGSTAGSVRVTQHRALQQLRALIADDPDRLA